MQTPLIAKHHTAACGHQMGQGEQRQPALGQQRQNRRQNTRKHNVFV